MEFCPKDCGPEGLSIHHVQAKHSAMRFLDVPCENAEQVTTTEFPSYLHGRRKAGMESS